MGKTIFTIVFLFVAIFFVTKVQTFIKNNKPVPAPAAVINHDEYGESTDTSGHIEPDMATTSDEIQQSLEAVDTTQ